jgi:hypothetical protein
VLVAFSSIRSVLVQFTAARISQANAQIAAGLHISTRTVGSHLDPGSGTRPAAAAAST